VFSIGCVLRQLLPTTGEAQEEVSPPYSGQLQQGGGVSNILILYILNSIFTLFSAFSAACEALFCIAAVVKLLGDET